MTGIKPMLAVLLLSVLPLTPALAQSPAARQITVTGSGEARAIPDQAELSAGVVSEATTAQAAVAHNNAKMTAVFTALEGAGIARAEVRTSGLSLVPDYANAPGQVRHIQGYTVRDTVTVTVDHAQNVGAVLDRLIGAGANEVDSVRFVVSNPAPYRAKARAAAVGAAVQAAHSYAQAAHVELGPIQSISAGGEGLQPMAMRVAGPMAPGTQLIRDTVTITWSLQ